MESETELVIAVPQPKDPHCELCGDRERIALAFSHFTQRWWIVCRVPGCLHLAVAKS